MKIHMRFCENAGMKSPGVLHSHAIFQNTLNSNRTTFLHNRWATYLLGVTNIFIFGTYGFGNPGTIMLLELGANFPPYSLDNEPYRLLTSMFLHGSLIHLLANMYSLYYVGIQVERRLGSLRFLIVYFFTGLVAGLVSLNFNLFVISVGASGAIFGIYGFLIVDTIKRNPRNKASILINFFLYLIVITWAGSNLNFDNAAHIGGVSAGIVAGLLRKQLKLQVIFTFATLFSVVVIVYIFSPRHQVEYFRSYQGFVETDRHLSKIFNARLNDNDFYDSLLKIEKLPEKVITEFRSLDFIPVELTSDTISIINFLEIRNDQIDYFLKGVSKESYIYLDSVSWLGSQIILLPPIKYNLNFKNEFIRNKPNEDTTERLSFTRQNYDSNWFETDSYEFEFYRIGEKDSLGDWHGRVEDFYRNGAIQMKGSYYRGLKDGIFLYYNSDSSYTSAGRYAADNRIGKWETYHGNGVLQSEIRYKNGSALVENIWDSSGYSMVSKGQGIEIYKYLNGIISYKRSIVDGLNHGFIESYYENGDLKFKEYYENGDLIKGVSYSGTTQNTYDLSVYVPFPEGGFEVFYEYLEKENKLKSDSINEVVIIRFDVHYTGRINNIRFLKRYKKEYDAYSKELLVNGPIWYPARSHALNEISSYAEVTIRF